MDCNEYLKLVCIGCWNVIAIFWTFAYIHAHFKHRALNLQKPPIFVLLVIYN